MLGLTPNDSTEPVWVETQSKGAITNLWLFVLLQLNNKCNLGVPICHTLLQLLDHLCIRSQYIHRRLQV